MGNIMPRSILYLAVFFILSWSLYPAYGLGIPSILPDSPFYGFKLFAEDMKEAFTFDDQAKAELKTIHAIERTLESETMAKQNKQIPIIVQENYVKKMHDIGEIIKTPRSNSDNLGFFDRLKVSFTILANQDELNQIRFIVTDFDDMKKLGYEQKVWRSELLDDKINNMHIVKSTCPEPISSLELSESNHPYKRLQEVCPALASLPIDDAYNILFNNE